MKVDAIVRTAKIKLTGDIPAELLDDLEYAIAGLAKDYLIHDVVVTAIDGEMKIMVAGYPVQSKLPQVRLSAINDALEMKE